MNDCYLIGIDVGSAEVRCGLVSSNGNVCRVETKKISINSPHPGYFQQSSDEIWIAITSLIKRVTDNIDRGKVAGIGCDATCSLVLIGKDGHPVSVSPKGEPNQNIIMWMDHRASLEAEAINNLNHPLLQYLGGKVSLEMQMPKIMWLKKNIPQCFDQAEHFFDLPDFLTWKLTGNNTRSQCSLVCKWMYEGSLHAENPGWNKKLLESIGLAELADDFIKIGKNVVMPGQLVGGLDPKIAKELGLKEGTPVGGSLIDAHAGTLGLIASKLPPPLDIPITNKIGMICGTSSCFMLLSSKGVKVDGVWGPYYGAVLENLWLSEGGQSSAGQLLDHLVSSHPAKPISSDPSQICATITATLNDMATSQGCPIDLLTQNFHLYPDFRGNRSPLADPHLRGMISGLDTSADKKQLALIYLSAIQALSYSAKQTVEKLESRGLGPVQCIVLCGGLTKNKLYKETLASALARPVVIPKTSEAVLLGSAMLGAAAAKLYPSLSQCAQAMASTGTIIQEFNQNILSYHERKYKVYLKMQADQIAYRNIMNVMFN